MCWPLQHTTCARVEPPDSTHLYEQLPDLLLWQRLALGPDVVVQVASRCILHADVQLALLCSVEGWQLQGAGELLLVLLLSGLSHHAASQLCLSLRSCATAAYHNHLLQEGVIELGDVGRIQRGHQLALLDAVLLLLRRHTDQVDLLERILEPICLPYDLVHCAEGSCAQFALNQKAVQR